MIIICLNNNAVINNNYGRLQDHFLLLKIPMGTRKNFFEICRHALGNVQQPWSKAWVYGRSLAGIAGSNATGGNVMCLL